MATATFAVSLCERYSAAVHEPLPHASYRIENSQGSWVDNVLVCVVVGCVLLIFDGVLLTLVNPKFFAGLKRFSAKPTRESWAFTAKTGGIGTMRLCFDENGQFYDGSWSSSNCSLLACGSIVAQVKHVGTETHVWTECQGSCPCTSIVIATTKTATAMSGKYAGGNCLGGESGTFDAVAQPFKN